jgi:hypothetical protein
VRQDFAVGDRVRFSGEHPWSGYVGVIVDPIDTSVGEGWSVELEGQGGMRACAFTDEHTIVIINENEGRSQIP